MEKNQHHRSTASTEGENNAAGNQPGQQLPGGAGPESSNESAYEEQKEQHSESSFPQQEGETLGTP